MQGWRRFRTWMARGVWVLLAVVLPAAVGIALLLRTAWGTEQLRALVVSQANQYLTATLEIDRLGGSLLRGVELDGVRLSRDGRVLVALDRVVVSYSPGELFSGGTLIRRLVLDGLRVQAAREPDGRWDVAALIRRDPNRPPSQGPPRPIQIDTILIRNGNVRLGNAVMLGAAHVPTGYRDVNIAMAFASGPDGWRVDFSEASFTADDPALQVNALSGAIGSGPEGWHFRDLHVESPGSAFTLTGDIDRRVTPTRLDLTVAAPRFAFQEWGGVLTGLRNIAVEAGFNARLSGPPAALQTSIDLQSSGGALRATLVLDSSVPGWHGAGAAAVQRVDVARWLNRPDRPSDITGEVEFDLDLHLGGRFPAGTFRFNGPRAAYLGYTANDVVARGRITDTQVELAAATATAYGANVRLSPSTLAIDSPYPFHFVGRAAGLDLRQLPPPVPVPHVESTLALDYDVTGQFTDPFITGSAIFDASTFLGASIEAGATGAIDTHAEPLRYSGEGTIDDVDLNRFGHALEITWLREPRYAGTVRGHFRVSGTGSELATMTLEGGGRLASASVFEGQLSDADVSVSIAEGSLTGRYDGRLFRVNPAVAMDDPRFQAQLTGLGRGDVHVLHLLTGEVTLDDYTAHASLALRDAEVRGVVVTTGEVEATLERSTLSASRLVLGAPGADLEARGSLELDGVRSSRVEYQVTHSDLARLPDVVGPGYEGELVTHGTLTGPLDRPRLTGEATLSRFAAPRVTALATTARYDVTLPDFDAARAIAAVEARATFVQVLGRELPEFAATLTYDTGRLTASATGRAQPDLALALDGVFHVDPAARTLEGDQLTLSAFGTTWRLPTGTRPLVAWSDAGLDVRDLSLADIQTGQQQVRVDGTWRSAGGGALRVAGRRLSLDALLSSQATVPRVGGTLDVTAVISGTADRPTVSAEFAVTNGRVRRLPFDRVGGRLELVADVVTLDVRLDQATGVWLTASGTVPIGVFDRTSPPQPVNVVVRSSPVGLTLVEGVTDVVRDVDGEMQLDVTVIGTSQDPHFTGTVNVRNARFRVVSSGARYRNGRVSLRLASDRVDVQQLRVEDEQGNPLELTGSLGTHEMRVGDLRVAMNARQFRVLNNEYGQLDIDARLNVEGEFESPRLTGRIAVSGGTLSVDRILDRTLFQPYATQEATLPELDPIVALNPWSRMGLGIELNVPGTLRLVGENVQVTPGTPLGLGDINLRVIGDLYLYKDPSDPLYVNGSFDSVSGTYAFQGRRFDLDPTSSINFRGDLSPELYVVVSRIISGVETRVSIIGPMQQPELRLSSVPPLDPSDVLSLIVFNTSTNELSALQQQQLAVRAGTLAAGFIAAPMVAALERSLGIDTLEIEPGADIRSGPRVTIGNEIAPGLVARFSRQFGPADYDEATLEYYLSRILRIRATFSDAGTLSARSPFRRVERAGIDLLLFLSF